jgi:hypothetical protein
MTLANFVKLEPNIEKKLRVRPGSFRLEPRTIPDPGTRQPRLVTVAVMTVTEEDGKPVQKEFSTLSEKLATGLKAAADNGTLYGHTIGIKKVGAGYVTEYQIRIY